MRLQRLALTDFRNYARCVWEPSAPIAVLTGENGSGKTNLLEGLSLLAPGRGLRGAPASQFVRSGERRWGVAARFERGDDRFEIATGNAEGNSGENSGESKNRRVFQLDRHALRSQSEIAAYYSCVWLTPQMDRLFGESASGRRRFLDRLVMGVSPDHARQMAAHERSVQSRNRLLSAWGERADEAWLEAVETSISRHAVAATASRMAFVERMNAAPFATQDFPLSLLKLECPIAAQLADRPALAVEDWLCARLREARPADRQKGTTCLGAHRTDFALEDAASGRPAALSSSGQQKVMMLGVVLAHAQLVAEANGAPPVILLDEPLVHLDSRHRHALLACLKEVKTATFLTGTHAEEFSPLRGEAAFINVKNGTLQAT